MTGLEVEVITWSVEIGREEVYGIEAKLGSVGLGLDEEHLLRESVGGISLFRITVPKVRLGERYGRELRIGTDGSERDELGNVKLTRVLHELESHDGVVVEEPPRICAVRTDAAHHGGKVDQEIRTGALEKTKNRIPIPEITVLRSRHRDAPSTSGADLLNNDPSKKSGAPRDDDGL